MGLLLRARLRDAGDDPLLRPGHLDRVLGADVEGRGRRARRRQVPDQRARDGQAQVADRGVPRVLRGSGRAAHRRLDARHRRDGRRAARARRRVPDDSGRVLRRSPRPRARGQAAARRPAHTGHPRGPRRRGLPAADLHEAGRRPSDRVLRGDRAPRRARLRRRQLQGAVRGHRARAGPAWEPLGMRYHSLGEVPAKRHAQTRRDGKLLVEEVMGYEGFSGNESILYHLHSPCRLDEVGQFTPLVREAWVPDAHVHRLGDANAIDASGDPINGRTLLMWNNDIEVFIAKPDQAMDGWSRNGEGDEVVYVHRGAGVVRTIFGTLPFREKDYVVIPRGTTHRWEFEEGSEQFWICFHTPGEIETPNRYRNRYGQLLEHAPYSQRDFHPPQELETSDDSGAFQVTLRVRGGLQQYLLDRHPLDVVGWDGYVYPYTFNAMDFEPRAGRFHLPPPAHQTFQGPNFVICTFAPRMLDWDETAVPLPYHHSNIQSEEVMFY